jgi:hypothetical protein
VGGESGESARERERARERADERERRKEKEKAGDVDGFEYLNGLATAWGLTD